ncbi:MAG: transglycosylase domain-containing protein [Enterocloster sp.]
MDQHTGYVKAVNGGRGTKEISLSLNRATNTLRQPGSTFKVLTAFAPALDTCGATLSTVYYDAPYTVGQKTFRNWYAKKGYMGYSTIRDGIVYSMNIVAVRCMMETVTPQLGVEYARNFGITSLTETDYNAATALGGITKGVSNLELTGAYAAIANGGIYTKPVFFTKILDHNGKVLLENEPQTKRVLKDSTAFLLTDALAESMESSRMYASPGVSLNSTSVPANIPGMSNAGKSGTTTSNVDIWFVGYTPYYTAGIWSGCDDNQKISAIGAALPTTNGSGSNWPVPRGWQTLASRFPTQLRPPACAGSRNASNPVSVKQIPEKRRLYRVFCQGTVPTQVCDHHVAITVCGESGGLPRFCPLESGTAGLVAGGRIRRHRRLPVRNARTVYSPYPVCCGAALGKRDRSPRQRNCSGDHRSLYPQLTAG